MKQLKLNRIWQGLQSLYLAGLGMVLTAPAMAGDGGFQFKPIEPQTELLKRDVGDNVIQGGQILLLAVSVIAFAWISYAAIAKFRECQKGLADWSELLVLGVAAGAILVFVTILLSQAGGLVAGDEG